MVIRATTLGAMLDDIEKFKTSVRAKIAHHDARPTATSSRGTCMVGYNVQTGVVTKKNLILSHQVTNIEHDRTQLVSMSAKAQKAVGKKKITVVAERGNTS